MANVTDFDRTPSRRAIRQYTPRCSRQREDLSLGFFHYNILGVKHLNIIIDFFHIYVIIYLKGEKNMTFISIILSLVLGVLIGIAYERKWKND